MIVFQGEAVAEQVEARVFPIGTLLEFSIAQVTDNTGASEHVMQPGVVVGYDELGPAKYILIERADSDNVPYGETRVISSLSLRKLVDVIEIDPDTELLN